MKRLLWLILFNISIAAAQDAPLEIFRVPDFSKGVITRYNPSLIPDNALQWGVNIYVDERGITRRKGFSQFNSAVFTNEKSVRGMWGFIADDGSRYILALSSQTIYKAPTTGVFDAIAGLSGFSATSDMDAVPYLGKIWFTNGVDSMAYWDGASTKTVTEGPLGSLIEGWRNRLVTAGVSGALSYIYMSKELDGEEWTTGPTTSVDPVAIAVGGTNAKPIKCMYAGYKDFLFIATEDEVFGVYGFGRNDFVLRTISKEVGCIEDKSVQEKDGALYWLSRRGVEKMTGQYTTERISDNVRDVFDALIGNTGVARNKIYTTQAHWEAGTLVVSGPGASVSATISPGSLVPSTWTRTDTSQVDFSTGTTVNVSTTQTNGSIEITGNAYSLLDDFNDEMSSWTIASNEGLGINEGSTDTVTQNTIAGSICGKNFNSSSGAGFGVLCFYSVGPVTQKEAKVYISTQSQAYGKWGLTVRMFEYDVPSNFTGEDFKYYFISSTSDTTTTNGYYLEINVGSTGYEKLMRVSAGSETLISSRTLPLTSTKYLSCNIEIIRNSSDTFIITGSTITSVASGQALANQCNFINFTGTDSVNTAKSNYQIFDVTNLGVTAATTLGMSIDDVTIGGFFSSGTFTSQIFNTTFSTPIGGPFSFTETVPAGSTIAYSVRESTWNAIAGMGAWNLVSTTTSGAYRIPLTKQYWQYKSDFSTDYSSQTPSIQDVTLTAATTADYIHSCAVTDTINSWGNFQANSVLDGGSIAYYVSTGASCDSVERATATWNLQNNNAPIIISTAAHIGVKEIFTISASTNTALLRDVTVNWLEGANRPNVASAVYLERYYLAYTTSTASPRNDYVFVSDRNDAITFLENMSCYSMVLFNRRLYCGDANATGKIYQLEIGEDDDGEAYTSIARTKAYSFGNPDAEKEYVKMYATIVPESDSALNVNITPSYHLDLSTTAITLNPVNTGEDSTAGMLVGKIPFAMSNNISGRFLDVNFQAGGTSQPFTLFGLNIYFRRYEVK